MEKEKKKWETPKLVCLYRGRPEEAVLAACKALNTVGPSRPANKACVHSASGPCLINNGT